VSIPLCKLSLVPFGPLSLQESKSGLEASLVSSGHSYASARLSADHSLAGALGEATGKDYYISAYIVLVYAFVVVVVAEGVGPELTLSCDSEHACY